MICLTLLTKDNCKLCVEMKLVIHSLKKEYQIELTEVDITSDKKLFEKYCEKIPVLLLNRRIIAKYRITRDELKKKISSASRDKSF